MTRSSKIINIVELSLFYDSYYRVNKSQGDLITWTKILGWHRIAFPAILDRLSILTNRLVRSTNQGVGAIYFGWRQNLLILQIQVFIIIDFSNRYIIILTLKR